jgi:hypothetical protein
VGEVPPLAKVARKYRDRGFEFLVVYVRESHPGENFPHHTSFEQKLAHARKLKELENVELPILVDDLRGSIHRAYGLLSNMVYVIDRQGTIVYKSDWTDSEELDEVCRGLLRREERIAAGVPILRTARSTRLHWIPMDPALRERVYRRSGEKAIRDYLHVMGHLPFASDAERQKARNERPREGKG